MARTPFVPRSALKQVLITGATVSPDGESIVTTAAAKDEDPRFSPDDGSILFTSDRPHDDDPKDKEPKTQLWVLPLSGGESRRLG